MQICENCFMDLTNDGIEGCPTCAHIEYEDKLRTKISELKKVVKKFGNACDKLHKEKAIIQPFLSIWKEHGELIEKCRNN